VQDARVTISKCNILFYPITVVANEKDRVPSMDMRVTKLFIRVACFGVSYGDSTRTDDNSCSFFNLTHFCVVNLSRPLHGTLSSQDRSALR
jgi:hypothetical protein